MSDDGGAGHEIEITGMQALLFGTVGLNVLVIARASRRCWSICERYVASVRALVQRDWYLLTQESVTAQA